MGFIKFVIWTACAMALGIYISTARYESGTPLEHLQRLWAQHGPSDAVVRQNVKGALETARVAVKTSPLAEKKAAEGKPAAERPLEAPVEVHAPEDREAVNKLIARRAEAK